MTKAAVEKRKEANRRLSDKLWHYLDILCIELSVCWPCLHAFSVYSMYYV